MRSTLSEQHGYGVKRLCTIVGVARSSFYYWHRMALDRAARQAADAQLAARVWSVHRNRTDKILTIVTQDG